MEKDKDTSDKDAQLDHMLYRKFVKESGDGDWRSNE